MKLLYLSKYPPISGGVSTHSYVLSRGLARAGHSVCVVSHALCCGPDAATTRSCLTGELLEVPNLRVRYVDADVCPPQLPPSDKFVSRVSSMALDETRREQYDLVFSHYMEPYGVAGFLVSRLARIPWAHAHAGSDLTTLGESPALSSLYDDLMRSCDLLLSRTDLMDRFRRIGVSSERLAQAPCLVPAPELISPEIPCIEWDALPVPAGVFPPPPETPVILMYGKLGGYKGAIELIDACRALRTPYHLLFATSTNFHRWLTERAARAGIAAHVGCVGLLPHPWIGRLLGRTAVACQLEHDFPIGLHHSVVPLEVLAAGCCLVVSNEIFSKQLDPCGFRDGQHLRVVDPKDVSCLTSVLEQLLAAPEQRAQIAQEGRQLFVHTYSHSTFVDTYVELFTRLAALRGVGRDRGGA